MVFVWYCLFLCFGNNSDLHYSQFTVVLDHAPNAVFLTILRLKGYFACDPIHVRVMSLQPWHPNNDRMFPERDNIECNDFRVYSLSHSAPHLFSDHAHLPSLYVSHRKVCFPRLGL